MMDRSKVAVSATGGSIHGQVEERFGRAPYFVVVDPETMKFGLITNHSTTAAHGAGPRTAALLAEQGVGVVITGRIGPKAAEALAGLGIQVEEGASGGIKAAVEGFLSRGSTVR